ncbi:MAG TPA: sugar-binding protein, partial [Kofleriaceae bacterium]|nr:sugar-binding protein [Kofleriaceae bacterium]
AGPITIDGIGTEPGWGNAVASTDFVTADGSPDPVGKAMARMTWDEQNLYVFVSITDTDVFSPYTKHDEPLWKADCVEIFIDADGNRRGYVELQVNPNNATFDSYFATTRAQPGDETWDSNMQPAVKVRGTADKAGDRDQGWDVELAIPLAAVKGRADTMPVKLPPEVGDRWRLNVVRVDYRSGAKDPGVASWNRISYSDFHALDRMLNVVFADGTGSIVKKPESAVPEMQPEAPSPGQPATTPSPSPGQPATTPSPTPPAKLPAQPLKIQLSPSVQRAPTGASPTP